MSQRIFKYPITAHSEVQYIELPVGAQMMSVAHVPGTGPCLYAIVNPDLKSTEQRALLVIGTGWLVPPIPEGARTRFIGTIVCPGDAVFGVLVWHAFEVIEAPKIPLVST
jgi:hypothetical protein